MNIEANLVIDLFRTQLLLAAINYQKDLAMSLLKVKQALPSHCIHFTKQSDYLKQYSLAIEEGLQKVEELEEEKLKTLTLPSIEEQAKIFSEQVHQKIKSTRLAIDHLETLTDDQKWPLPKYWELLFMV